MARKSRKKVNAQISVTVPAANEEKPSTLATAAYARLSVEKLDEGSIQTQIAFLHNYIEERPELQLVETYIEM